MTQSPALGDPSRCTIVITVHGRQHFLPRVTAYYADFGADVLVTDSSPNPAQAHYLIGPRVRYEHVPGEAYYRKMLRVHQSVNTPYVVECPDDDFVLKTAIREAIAIMDHDSDTVCVAGSVVNLSSRQMRIWEESRILHVRNMAFNRPEFGTLRRLAATMYHFTALNHFVFRKDVLVNGFGLVVANRHLWPVRFFDKILAYVTAAAGRVRFIGRPMCVRDETRVMDTSAPYPEHLELNVQFSEITDRLRHSDPLAVLLLKVFPGTDAENISRLNRKLFSRTFGNHRQPPPSWLMSRYGDRSAQSFQSEIDEVLRLVRTYRSNSDRVACAYSDLRERLSNLRRKMTSRLSDH
jgi:glycosyltransferase domain-containing protein